MIFQGGHPKWEKDYDAAVAKGRGDNPDREAAIRELKALGMTYGEAVHAIDNRKK